MNPALEIQYCTRRGTLLWFFKTVFLLLATTSTPAQASLTQPTNTMEAGIHNAIMRGDAQELRTLLGQAGKLSANDSAIAQRALSSMGRLGAQDARLLAQRYGIDWANKVQHALKTASDGPVKRALFQRYGSAEAVFAQVDKALNALSDLPNGKFIRTLLVDGMEVTVRAFKDGIAVIGTIEKW